MFTSHSLVRCDHDVVLLQLFRGHVARGAVVRAPGQRTLLDVILDLLLPVGKDREWDDCIDVNEERKRRKSRHGPIRVAFE